MKINSVYEAIGGVDDRFVSEAAVVRRKRPMMLIVVAAAAVLALGLIVGFYNYGHPNYVFRAGDGSKMNYDVQLKHLNIPDEYNTFETDERGYKHYSNYSHLVEETASELFAEFGLKPLTSENFTEDFDYTPLTLYGDFGFKDHLELPKYPRVRVSAANVINFSYVLYDKNIDEYIGFAATYIYNTHIEGYSEGIQGKEEHEWLNLKGGASCYVSNAGARFSYDGAIYSLDFYDTKKRDIETVKQVLADLGLL